jgi:hypothetical protein
MLRLFIAIVIMSLFSSCYSYKVYPKEYRDFSYEGEREKVYVLNPGLSKELQILKRSGIFNIISDTIDNTVVKIQLYPLKGSFACGQPIIASLFTLGQVPVLFPDRYQYEFDEVRNSGTVRRSYELKIAKRYWFWDMFLVKKNFHKKAGQTLLAGYYKD